MVNELQNLTKEELLPLLFQASGAVEQLQTEKEKLELEATYLKNKVALLSRLLYGQKRERFEKKEQPELPFGEAAEVVEKRNEETIEKIIYERKKYSTPHPGRHPLPEHLAIEVEIIEPECDLTDMVKIGEEVTDILEYNPASFYIKRYIRHKYARKDKEGIVVAKLPARTFEKCLAGNSLLTSIIVDKYVDHLPLYRQIQRFKREKIPISSSSVDGWVKQVVGLLKVLYDHLKTEIKTKGYLQADETPIKVLDQDKKGKCHLGYFWAYRCPIDKIMLFDYQRGRSLYAAEELLGDYKGYLQTDGYKVYDNIGKRKGVVHLNCWAHARREFDRALDNDKERASMALAFIQSLYKVEAEARENNLDAHQRKEHRLVKSLPTLNAFGKWLMVEHQSGKVLPQSAIGKAIAYTLNRWEKLNAYLNDGMLEIDNNLIENAIRPIAIGRKNYLFAGSHEGAERAAIVYSFFAMCKMEEVNPAHWLKYVLDNLQDAKINNLEQFYPKNFKELCKM